MRTYIEHEENKVTMFIETSYKIKFSVHETKSGYSIEIERITKETEEEQLNEIY